MNTQESNFNCTNPDEGRYIARYEMGWLTESECKGFEEHMMVCNFCSTEAEKMLPLARVMRNYKGELASELHKSGITFESLKQEYLKNASAKTNKNGLTEKIKVLLNRKIWIPALVGAAALIIIVNQADFRTEHRTGPTINLHEVLRDNIPTETINLGIEKYRQKKFKEAIEIFGKIIKQDTDNAQVYYYLGASAYCLKDDRAALDALSKADSLSEHSIPDAAYYLALIYSDHKEFNKAKPILEQLIQRQQDQSGRAKELLEKIGSAK